MGQVPLTIAIRPPPLRCGSAAEMYHEGLVFGALVGKDLVDVSEMEEIIGQTVPPSMIHSRSNLIY